MNNLRMVRAAQWATIGICLGVWAAFVWLMMHG
jgi:hypothetical protein